MQVLRFPDIQMKPCFVWAYGLVFIGGLFFSEGFRPSGHAVKSLVQQPGTAAGFLKRPQALRQLLKGPCSPSAQASLDRRSGVIRLFDKVDDDDERETLRLEAVLDKRLVLAGRAMLDDVPAHVALLAAQAVPMIGLGMVGANFLFFWMTAVLSVYLGAKRGAAVAKAGEVFQSLNVKNAVAAPIAASISLFGTYYLLKNLHLDIKTVYQLMTTSFGWLCLRDVVASGLLGAGLTGLVTDDDLEASDTASPALKSAVFPAKLVGSLLAALTCGAYLYASNSEPSAALLPVFVLSANAITTGIALQAQGNLSIKSLRPALLFLAGLWLYDTYFVFFAPGSVMETVATSVEGPVKFVSPRLTADPSQYPFSILGLGDVVIPGIFVGLLKRLDEALQTEKGEQEGGEGSPYFNAGMAGYAIGLLLTFAANLIMARGQPALLYINPCLILGALGTAGVRGEWDRLWAFGEKPATQKE